MKKVFAAVLLFFFLVTPFFAEQNLPPATTLSSTSVNFYSGWNLVSSFVNGYKIDAAYLKNSGATKIWAYNAAKQTYTLPDYLEPGIGYWVYALNAVSIQLSSANFSPAATVDMKTILAGASVGKWSLLGTPFDTTVTTIKLLGATQNVWWYDALAGQYSSGEQLKSGSGFWFKGDVAISANDSQSIGTGKYWFDESYGLTQIYCQNRYGGQWNQNQNANLASQGRYFCTMSYQNGLQYCQDLGGRLPSMDELKSSYKSCLVSSGKNEPQSCFDNGFLGYDGWGVYLSGTDNNISFGEAQYNFGVYTFSFFDGATSTKSKDDTSNYTNVRCHKNIFQPLFDANSSSISGSATTGGSVATDKNSTDTNSTGAKPDTNSTTSQASTVTKPDSNSSQTSGGPSKDSNTTSSSAQTTTGGLDKNTTASPDKNTTVGIDTNTTTSGTTGGSSASSSDKNTTDSNSTVVKPIDVNASLGAGGWLQDAASGEAFCMQYGGISSPFTGACYNDYNGSTRYCQALNGRLPTNNELIAPYNSCIVTLSVSSDNERYGSKCIPNGFLSSDYYWSSTEKYSNNVYIFSYSNGWYLSASTLDKSVKNYVRCHEK